MVDVNTDEIRKLVSSLFLCEFDQLTDETGPGDIPRWDSLGHIQLLEALSDHFGHEIAIEQAIEARNIRELAQLVSSSSGDQPN